MGEDLVALLATSIGTSAPSTWPPMSTRKPRGRTTPRAEWMSAAVVTLLAVALLGCGCVGATRILVELTGSPDSFDQIALTLRNDPSEWAFSIADPDGEDLILPTSFGLRLSDAAAGTVEVCGTAMNNGTPIADACETRRLRIGWTQRVTLRLELIACDNGALEPEEECDGENLAGATCASLGLGDGELRCDPGTCKLDLSECRYCGNGTIDAGEACDGSDLGGADCAAVVSASDGGTLGCFADCTFNTSDCIRCGDGRAEGLEECDGEDLAGMTCRNNGMVGGPLRCNPDCTINDSSCELCGNDQIDQTAGEECDNDEFGSWSCMNWGSGSMGGELRCGGDCTIDDSLCHTCGDGVVDPEEECDGAPGSLCSDLGFASGILVCGADCDLDTSGCTELPTCGNGACDGTETCRSCEVDCGPCMGDGICDAPWEDCESSPMDCGCCGNGFVDVNEDCDGMSLSDHSCATIGLIVGVGPLACTPSCEFDLTTCETCGNGRVDVDANEVCDGSDLAMHTCNTAIGWDGDNLRCSEHCDWYIPDCWTCGDGYVDGAEDCDLLDLGGTVCSDISGFRGGVLACTFGCLYDTSGCLPE